MAAHQALPSLGFSRQEHWSRLPFPSPMHESERWKWSRSVVSDSLRPRGLQPTRLLRPWDCPGKSTGVGCHCLLRYQELTFPKYWMPWGMFYLWTLILMLNLWSHYHPSFINGEAVSHPLDRLQYFGLWCCLDSGCIVWCEHRYIRVNTVTNKVWHGQNIWVYVSGFH